MKATVAQNADPAEDTRRAHRAALDALRGAVARNSRLWHGIDAPDAPVPGLEWTAAETAAHVVGDMRKRESRPELRAPDAWRRPVQVRSAQRDGARQRGRRQSRLRHHRRPRYVPAAGLRTNPSVGPNYSGEADPRRQKAMAGREIRNATHPPLARCSRGRRPLRGNVVQQGTIADSGRGKACSCHQLLDLAGVVESHRADIPLRV
jgi:hypothetical protein